MTEESLNKANDITKELKSLKTILRDIENIHFAGTYIYIPKDEILIEQIRDVVTARMTVLENELKEL